MIYKNARIYSYPVAIQTPIIGPELHLVAFKPCAPCQPKSAGFVPPFEDGRDMIHQANGTTLVCLQIQERMLPPAVINKALREEVARIEEEQERKVYRKERLLLKESIIDRLLPQAFTKDKRILAHIDHQHGLLIVDTASASTAELLLNKLREAVGGLPVTLLDPSAPPHTILRRLINTWDFSHNIRASLEARLADPEGAGSVTIKNEDLHSEEIQALLEVGMIPEELRVEYIDRGRFTITDDLAIKRIRLSDALIHATSGDLEDSAKLDADYHLNVETLREIYQEMRQLFGIDAEPGQEAAIREQALGIARETLARHEATVSIIDDQGRETPIGTANTLKFLAGAQ